MRTSKNKKELLSTIMFQATKNFLEAEHFATAYKVYFFVPQNPMGKPYGEER